MAGKRRNLMASPIAVFHRAKQLYAADSMASETYLVRTPTGQVLGPMRGSELAAAAKIGTITPECLVQRSNGSGTWHPAGSIRGLVFGVAIPAMAPAAAAWSEAPSSPPSLSMVPAPPSAPQPVPPPAPQPAMPPAPPPVELWWFAHDGQTLGPVARQAVMQLHAAAGCPHGWSVMPQGGTTWQPIETAWPAAAGAPVNGAAPRSSEALDRWKALAARVPGLLGRPTATVVSVCDEVPNPTVIAFAAGVTVLASSVISTLLCVKFKDFMTAGGIAEVFAKSLAVLLVPWVSLSLANLGLRRVAVQGSHRGFGFDALVAATALLPVQTAAILFMILGLNEVSIGAVLFSLVLSTLLVFAINASDAVTASNRILFLTPLQYALAGYIAFFAYRQLLPNMGSLFGRP